MALHENQLFASAAGRGSEIRMVVRRNKVATLGAQSGAPKLPKACPVAFDKSTGLWTRYVQPSDAAIYTLTNAGGDLDGGTFELVIDGLSVTLPFNVTAANLQTEVNAMLADAGKPYTISAAATAQANLGVNGAVITITFGENAGAPSVDVATEGLTDGGVSEPAGVVLAASDAGTQLNGTDQIRGFVQDVDGVQSDASDEVQFTVMLEGEIHRDDVNTSAIRSVLGGAPSEAELDAALRDQNLRALGLHVRGLSGVS